jgi:hypothetical protein
MDGPLIAADPNLATDTTDYYIPEPQIGTDTTD